MLATMNSKLIDSFAAHFLHGPLKGQEEAWLAQVKDFHQARAKHLKTIKVR